MINYILKLHLHPSIPTECRVLEGEVSSDFSLLEGILSLLKSNSDISQILVSEDDIRPGYLLISDKIELRTTKKLYNKIASNIEIRVIPISHGG